MIEVRNKRTGVVTRYPRRQAEWLVSIGRCELVTTEPEPNVGPAPKPKPKAKAKNTYKTKDMKAESNDVAIQPEKESAEPASD